jgi:outer membrane protein assembly factor BamB
MLDPSPSKETAMPKAIHRKPITMIVAAVALVLPACTDGEVSTRSATPEPVPASTTVAHPTPASPYLKWHHKLDHYAANYHHDGNSLVTADDTVYVATEHLNRDDYKKLSPCLCAFDIQTGIKKWEFNYAGTQASAPTVSNGLIFFNVLEPSPDIPENSISHLYALDASTGKEKWHFQSGSQGTAQPIVDGNIVYFATLKDRIRITDSSGKSINGEPAIYAFRIETGELLWKVPISADQWISATIYKGTLYFAADTLSVKALDLKSQTYKWQHTINEPYSSIEQIIVANDMVYIGERYQDTIRTLDANTGEARWTYEADTGRSQSNQTGACCLFSPSEASKQSLNKETDIRASSVYTSYAPPMPGLKTLPALADQTLVVGLGVREGTAISESSYSDMEGFMIGLDSSTGKETWRTRVHRVLYGWQTPLVKSDTAYLVANSAPRAWDPITSQALYALNTSTGQINWKQPILGLPSPQDFAIEEGQMIGIGWQGELYAISIPEIKP